MLSLASCQHAVGHRHAAARYVIGPAVVVPLLTIPQAVASQSFTPSYFSC
jgi:hypothetical protein